MCENLYDSIFFCCRKTNIVQQLQRHCCMLPSIPMAVEEHCTKTFHLLLYTFFLWNKLSFQIQPSVDWIIFSKTCLPIYFLILYVSWSSFSASKLFYIRTNKILMKLTSTKCSYYVLIFHETFPPVNGKNYSWY